MLVWWNAFLNLSRMYKIWIELSLKHDRCRTRILITENYTFSHTYQFYKNMLYIWSILGGLHLVDSKTKKKQKIKWRTTQLNFFFADNILRKSTDYMLFECSCYFLLIQALFLAFSVQCIRHAINIKKWKFCWLSMDPSPLLFT